MHTHLSPCCAHSWTTYPSLPCNKVWLCEWLPASGMWVEVMHSPTTTLPPPLHHSPPTTAPELPYPLPIPPSRPAHLFHTIFHSPSLPVSVQQLTSRLLGTEEPQYKRGVGSWITTWKVPTGHWHRWIHKQDITSIILTHCDLGCLLNSQPLRNNMQGPKQGKMMASMKTSIHPTGDPGVLLWFCDNALVTVSLLIRKRRA